MDICYISDIYYFSLSDIFSFSFDYPFCFLIQYFFANIYIYILFLSIFFHFFFVYGRSHNSNFFSWEVLRPGSGFKLEQHLNIGKSNALNHFFLNQKFYELKRLKIKLMSTTMILSIHLNLILRVSAHPSLVLLNWSMLDNTIVMGYSAATSNWATRNNSIDCY